MPSALNMKRRGMLLFAVVCVVLLFFGGPDLIRTRSFKHAWDLGHIVFFAIATIWAFRLIKKRVERWAFPRIFLISRGFRERRFFPLK